MINVIKKNQKIAKAEKKIQKTHESESTEFKEKKRKTKNKTVIVKLNENDKGNNIEIEKAINGFENSNDIFEYCGYISFKIENDSTQEERESILDKIAPMTGIETNKVGFYETMADLIQNHFWSLNDNKFDSLLLISDSGLGISDNNSDNGSDNNNNSDGDNGESNNDKKEKAITNWNTNDIKNTKKNQLQRMVILIIFKHACFVHQIVVI